MLEGEANKGITYSNVDIRKTVAVIGWATSKAEYMNSLSHEMLHVVQHISEQFLINMYGEEACYLLGGLAQATFLTPKKEQVLNNYCIFAPIKHSNL